MAKRKEITLPTQREIEKLPLRAIVAFAAHCARRVEPLLTLYRPDASIEHKQAFTEAVDIAEQYATYLLIF